jgi:hypothetical protein
VEILKNISKKIQAFLGKYTTSNKIKTKSKSAKIFCKTKYSTKDKTKAIHAEWKRDMEKFFDL